MGVLNYFSRRPAARLTRLPAGSFTVDTQGRVVAYTLPETFPRADMQNIGRMVLAYFRGAQQAQVHVKELIVTYRALKLSAREMRGGAIVFLVPQSLMRN